MVRPIDTMLGDDDPKTITVTNYFKHISFDKWTAIQSGNRAFEFMNDVLSKREDCKQWNAQKKSLIMTIITGSSVLTQRQTNTGYIYDDLYRFGYETNTVILACVHEFKSIKHQERHFFFRVSIEIVEWEK